MKYKINSKQLAGQQCKQDKPSKLGQTNLVCDQSSSVGLCMQDYKSLCEVVMVCATLVNTQMHRQTAFDRLHY